MYIRLNSFAIAEKYIYFSKEVRNFHSESVFIEKAHTCKDRWKKNSSKRVCCKISNTCLNLCTCELLSNIYCWDLYLFISNSKCSKYHHITKCHHSLIVKTERSNSVTFQLPFSWLSSMYISWPFSNIRFYMNFVLKELIFCVFFHYIPVCWPLLHTSPIKRIYNVWMWQIWKNV